MGLGYPQIFPFKVHPDSLPAAILLKLSIVREGEEERLQTVPVIRGLRFRNRLTRGRFDVLFFGKQLDDMAIDPLALIFLKAQKLGENVIQLFFIVLLEA